MRKRFFLIVIILLFFLVSGGFVSAAVWSHTWKDKIFPRVRVGEIELGGLSEGEACELLLPVQEKFLAAKLTLILEDRQWQISRKNLGYQLSSSEIAHRAFLVGRKGSLWQRYRELWRAWRTGITLPLNITFDRQKALVVLAQLTKDFIILPESASLYINAQDEIIVTPGRPGKVLDKKASLAALEQVKDLPNPCVILHLREQQPLVRTEDILTMKIKGLLSSYTTYFDVHNVNRTYNINVAADALDNQFIKPDEVFSFNHLVGPRSRETGYKEALIIMQDQFIPGIGGGVCQVSSTLYNAVLLAGLEVIERSNHSLPVDYVPLGRDATVAYGGKDLKFRNNTAGYLLIRTKVRGGALVVKIFGNPEEKKNIRLNVLVDKVIEPKTIIKEDPNLYQGKTIVEREGIRGYQVRVYRLFEKWGALEKKLVSNDLYCPVDKIVRIGTMPFPETPVLSLSQDQPLVPVQLSPEREGAIPPGSLQNPSSPFETPS